jgi:hypothetical protein
MAAEAETILEWTVGGEDRRKVRYLLDGEELGEGPAGFDRVLRCLGRLAPGSRVTIRYPLVLGTTGRSFEEELPYSDRRDELDLAVARRGLRVVYEPRPEPS